MPRFFDVIFKGVENRVIENYQKLLCEEKGYWLKKKTKLFYVIFLPIKSLRGKKKMSKSNLSSGIFLMPRNKKYYKTVINILDNKKIDDEGILQFLSIWNRVFKEETRDTKNHIKSILKELTT